MIVFESQCIHMINFSRHLPGFQSIETVADRVILAVNAFYPLMMATLSLEYDISSLETARPFFLNGETYDKAVEMFPQARSYLNGVKQHFIDSGVAVKSANLTFVEFGFLCALIYFNSNLDGLQDRASVGRVAAQLQVSADFFIRSRFDTTAQSYDNAEVRISTLQQLIVHFKNVNNAHNWMAADFLNSCPVLVESSGEIFKEMYNRVFVHLIPALKQNNNHNHNHNYNQKPSTSSSWSPPPPPPPPPPQPQPQPPC